MNHQYAAWNVARLDVDPNKRGKPDVAPKISKAQAARLRKEIALAERDKQQKAYLEQAKAYREQNAKADTTTSGDTFMSNSTAYH
jgi:hypothetical protein